MSDTSAVLRKKVAPARAALPGGSSVAAMLRKVLPRVADKILSLEIIVSDVRFAVASKADVMAKLSEFDLIYPMEAKDEHRGIAVLSPGLLAALIEIQVAGRVSERQPPERPATRTDGIVAGDIVDRWMQAGQEAAEEEEITEALPTIGYARSERVLSIRNTDLVLDPVSYKVLEIELSIEGGAKTGVVTFALPPIDVGGDEDTAIQRMRGHLAEIEAPMIAILTRMPVPIEKIKNLAVDDILEVPIGSLLNIQLEGQGGQKITSARLGQLNGSKAVRLVAGLPEGETVDLNSVGELGGGADLGAVPALPEPAGLPDVGAPVLPDVPDVGGLDLPDLPGGDLPDLPTPGGDELPDLPSLDAPGGLPDLPDLPDLPPLEP